MAAIPLYEEMSGSPAGPMISSLADLPSDPLKRAQTEVLRDRRPVRRLSIYAASAGFDLVDELDFLCKRSIEPNVFFNPRFLAPAMPRVEDREVRLAVVRDGDEYRSRLRLLVPFSVERPATPFGVPIMRTWSSAFSPLGTPLIDRDDPVGVLEDFFSMLGREQLRLPPVLVLPEIRLDGPVANLLKTVALGHNLPLIVTGETTRPFIDSRLDGDAYLRQAVSKKHYKEFGRLQRRLEERGAVEYRLARSPDEVRQGLETFLALEAAGWKGRSGSAMAVDRFRAAFAREAVNRLSEHDLVRVHTLHVDGRAIACLIVFVEQGCAYTWKTAFDEEFTAYSPGLLLMLEVTRRHLDDPNIAATDSCAVSDHPMVSRIWTETRPMGTVVVGVRPGNDRAARQAASQLHLYQETRNLARLVRKRVLGLVGRGGA